MTAANRPRYPALAAHSTRGMLRQSSSAGSRAARASSVRGQIKSNCPSVSCLVVFGDVFDLHQRIRRFLLPAPAIYQSRNTILSWQLLFLELRSNFELSFGCRCKRLAAVTEAAQTEDDARAFCACWRASTFSSFSFCSETIWRRKSALYGVRNKTSEEKIALLLLGGRELFVDLVIGHRGVWARSEARQPAARANRLP